MDEYEVPMATPPAFALIHRLINRQSRQVHLHMKHLFEVPQVTRRPVSQQAIVAACGI